MVFSWLNGMHVGIPQLALSGEGVAEVVVGLGEILLELEILLESAAILGM
jgi:hypothetical protein